MADMINSNTSQRTDEPLASEKIQVDRKVFFLDLKENQRGRFLKITEDVSGRRDTIMLPASGFQEFVEALSRIIEFEQRL
jgi:PurA ssDNA and RNA-binding protein